MSFGSASQQQPRTPPPVPLIGSLGNEVAVRMARMRSKKRYGHEDTVFGSGGVGQMLGNVRETALNRAGELRATLLGGG